MKILLFGKGGQVGWELQRSLAPMGELIAVDFDSTDLCGDFSNLQGLVDTVRAVRPDAIVNAAAHTAVDRAESEPDLAQLINARAPAVLAAEAAALGAWLVHYSTDYVFDGAGSAARTEADATAPLNVYGRTKLAGEQAIAAAGCRHLILRTSWVYGARGGNFARTMLRLAQERDELNVIDDQIGAPTGADLLADVTATALRMALAQPALGGIYHAVAAGEVSWHAYAMFVLALARQHGVTLRCAPGAVLAVPTTRFPTAAQRPLNSRLDTSKLCRTFGVQMPPWQAGVARMMTEILEK